MKWVLAGVAAVLLGWYFLKPSAPPQVAMPSIPAMPKLMVDGQDIAGQTRAVAEGLAATFKTVKDEASAKAALPKLQDADKTLGTITGLAAKLPADGRKSLATGTSSLLTMLRPLIDQALAASGAGPVLKPIVDGILNKIQGLSKV
jgi:hypothetical protein